MGRILLSLLALIALAYLLRGNPPEANRPGVRTLTIWSAPTGMEERAFKKLLARYRKENPGLRIRNVGALDEGRALRAILAGTPPDLFYFYGTQLVGPLAANGAARSLDDYFRQSGFTAEDFLPAAIAQGSYRGKIYAMPVTRDTSALYWNKAVFRKAGLDPERPPRTLEEMAALAVRLTQKDEKGNIRVQGMQLPDIIALTFNMGGGFYDEAAGRITASTRENVAAFRWFRQLADRLGGYTAINRFNASAGNSESAFNPFFAGRIAMKLDGEWTAMHIQQYAPGLDYGVAPVPYPKRLAKRGSVSMQSGDVMMIPSEAAHPEEAWKFIRWLEQPTQQEEYAAGMNNLPTLRSLLNSPRLTQGSRQREVLGYILKNIANGPHPRYFPSLPVTQYYQSLLYGQSDMVLSGRKTPEEALAFVQKQVEEQMRLYAR
ncbi:MAG: ABC transporter substrate-binding protein [Armatimonadetes bacterium]|nr:ABC transporter substrate-binding protein [Armatimonadota bacterium]